MSVDVGVLDYFSSCARVFFFYNGVIEYDLIVKSLKETISCIPTLSYVIQGEKIGDEIVHKFVGDEMSSSSNVRIIQKKVNDRFFDLYKPKEDSENPYDQNEGTELFNLVEGLEMTNYIYSDKLLENSPLLKVTVLYTETSGKTIIGSTWSHVLGDFWSVNQYQKCLSSVLSREQKPFDFDRKMMNKRSLIEKREKEGLTGTESEVPQETLSRLINYFPRYQEPNSYVTYGDEDYYASNATYKLIHFRNESLKRLKEQVLREHPDAQRISSFDCVSAICWKIHALRHYTISDDTILPFIFYLNLRNRVTGFKWNYFGNCIVTPSIELSRKQIIESKFSDLVMKINRLKKSVTEKDVQYIVDNWKSEKPILFRRRSLIFNDWRMGDRFKPHFIIKKSEEEEEVVKCERFITYPPYRNDRVLYDWCCMLLRGDRDGVMVKFSFKDEFLKKLAMDINRFGTLEGLQQLQKRIDEL